MSAVDAALGSYIPPTPAGLAAALARMSAGLAAAAIHLKLDDSGAVDRLNEFGERVEDLVRAVRRVRAELRATTRLAAEARERDDVI